MTTTFKPYPKYKPSGVEWLGDIPEHWGKARTKELFNLVKREPEEADDIVTAFRDGQVTLRKNRRTEGFTNAVKEHGYQRIFPGDLVIHAMDAFAGAIGVSDSLGKSTPVYSVCVPKAEDDVHYYATLMRNMALSGFVSSLAKGIRERSTEFRWKEASNVWLARPPSAEQKAIASFLESETAKIDEIISGLDELVALANEEVSSMVFGNSKTKEMRLSWATREMSRPLPAGASGSFTKIGLFNRGRGLFHKDPSEADEMGDSDFFFVEEGDCIISGQFAWEGAVALADKEDTDCVVSHRYPVIRGKEGVALTEYIYALLCTTHGNFLLNDHSRGAAGRNRPLNIGTLLKEKVAIPDIAAQERVARAVHKKKEVLKEVKAMKVLLDEYRTSLIHEAVTGKIDLRKV